MAPGRVVHHRGYIHPQRRLTWAAETLPPRAVEYDEKQDLVRIPMEIGQSESLVAEVQVAFAHIAPKQCNMRLYYEKIGAWAEFHEK